MSAFSHESLIRIKDKSIEISDESLIPKEFQKLVSLIDSIININKEETTKIFEEITSELAQKSIYIISHAILIRHSQTKNLLTLISMLSKKFNLENFLKNEIKVESWFKELLFSEKIIYRKYNLKKQKSTNQIIYGINPESIENAIEEDNLESFIKIASEPYFDPNKSDVLNNANSWDQNRIFLIYEDERITYMHLMAFFGSLKCFKHAMLTGEYSIEQIQEYAIAGGNTEIIHLLENQGIYFDYCFRTATRFHRHELCDWLLLHYECEKVEMQYMIEFWNYKLLFFLMNNSNYTNIEISAALPGASIYDDICLVKYLIETRHVFVDSKDEYGTTALIAASKNNNIELIKYLIETHHASVDAEDENGLTALVSAAKNGNLDLVKYLIETCHAKVNNNNECSEGSALHQACKNGNLDLVKYLIETCHANVEAKDSHGVTPILYATNIDVIKYLILPCHANIRAYDEYGRSLFSSLSLNSISIEELFSYVIEMYDKKGKD